MAGELLVDTSGFVSLLDRTQSEHGPCAAFYRGWNGPVLTTEAVLTEATHLLGRTRGGPSAALRFILEGGAVLVPSTVESLRRTEALMGRYETLAPDYADLTLVVLAEDVGTPDVLTLDRRDFSVLRWRGRRPFRIHPAA